MRREDDRSIFSEYYQTTQIVDRFTTDRSRAVDVIVPIVHTNEIWRTNLLSIYREIPVNRLILGDGGCIDDSIEVAREFPRVEVLDHRSFRSLGFSLRHLIEEAKTEWFVYLHSDVYLPQGWFDTMCANRARFDWFECNQRITVMADYLMDTTRVARSYSGSQMGRRSAFETVTSIIDDDYLYRNEDIIIAKLVERAGYRYGKVGDTHHFHQVMHKPSRWRRAVKRVAIELDLGRDEDVRANRTYAQGIVKYLKPSEATPDLTASVRAAVERLVELEDMSEADFLAWVKDTNPSWLRELAPSSPTAAVALPGQLSRRDRAAERIHYLAELYRHHGGPGAALVVLKRLLRAAFPEWLWEHLRRAWVYSRRLWRHVRRVRFYAGRIMDEFHVAGVRGVVDLFKRNFSRGR